ncbi:MAG: hypothetical protein AMXMBFR75_12620 [Candidatus Hinthialibacteria bacterium]
MRKIAVMMAMCLAVTASAAPFKKVLGQNFPVVKSKDLATGQEIDTSKILAQEKVKGVVVFYTSIRCPVVHAYEERINAMAEKYKDVVPFIGLNANSSENEEAVTAYNKEKYKFQSAIDAGSATAKEIGASCTPEFYLLDKTGKVVYHGPFDDNQDASQIEKHLLSVAIEALLNSKPIPAEEAEMPAFGCSISFPKK